VETFQRLSLHGEYGVTPADFQTIQAVFRANDKNWSIQKRAEDGRIFYYNELRGAYVDIDLNPAVEQNARGYQTRIENVQVIPGFLLPDGQFIMTTEQNHEEVRNASGAVGAYMSIIERVRTDPDTNQEQRVQLSSNAFRTQSKN
tara:strand:- start:2875 stop:3309 length:435 start_codon:yes stop_codon:yes gene_type:complete